jgi:putative Mg2+ transporter-C (MgtC) family protein
MTNPWVHWWTDTVPLLAQPTFPRLFLATILGALIGAERQWRQRAAGMRTNTLVCFGAAALFDLGTTIGSSNTTNIIAYVVSGVGFLGAGAIMKEGGSIRGLNTAATLWCSAAVGACAGAGELLDAVFVTVLLISINLALRPLSRKIDRRSIARSRDVGVYRLTIVCFGAHEQEVSAVIMRCIAARPLIMRELRSEQTEDSGEVMIQAVVESGARDKTLIENLASELKANRM